MQKVCIAAALRLEGGQFYTGTVRSILHVYHDVRVGAYSYGQCMIPGAFPAGVYIGRYVSVGPAVQVYLRNHPLDRLSLHPFFYNPHLGWVTDDTIPMGTLKIEHDAWIGASAIVTPGCTRIGLGAVVGAGAIVTRDVPNFSVVAGNPARHVKFRFSEEVRAVIEASKWWELGPQECAVHLGHMIAPLPHYVTQHPLLRAAAASGMGR